MTEPLLIVVYQRGSATPRRIARAARVVGCRLLFLCRKPVMSDRERAVLSLLGEVLDASGLSLEEAVLACRGRVPAGILTFAEPELRFTAELAAELGLPHHHPDRIPAITLKTVQRPALRAAGIEGPASAAIHTSAEVAAAVSAVGFPAILKPSAGAGSRNTLAFDGEVGLRACVNELLGDDRGESDLLLEQLLVGRPTDEPWGDYIAVDCLAQGTLVRPMFVTSKFGLQRPYRERGGYGVPREDTALVREVEELACAAVAALGIECGIADVEIKLTAGGPRVIEVNGRLGAWVDDLSVRLGGADMVATALQCALGRPDPIRWWPSPALSPICYNYVLVPPPEVTRFNDRKLFSRLRALPGVLGVDQYKDDDDTDWRRGSASAVGAVRGCAYSHSELAGLVAAIEAEFVRHLDSVR